MKRLTAKRVKEISKPGRYGDGNCLFLRVADGGSKQWIQRLSIRGQRRDIGLGSITLVSLAEARITALKNRKIALVDREDPRAGSRKGLTFREAAERTHKANQARWRSARSRETWMASLDRHAFPTLGDMPVAAITAQDVLRALGPVWESRRETGRKVRQKVRLVLSWCLSHGLITTNVADNNLDAALPVAASKPQNLRALPFAEVADALSTVDSSPASVAVKLCFRFLALTATRSSEARGARWSEIDLDKREWRIPSQRMKAGIEHRVPLSAEALNVLAEARKLNDGSGLCFPSPKRAGYSLSPMSLTMTMRSTGLAKRGTVHGFRTAFRTWASEKTDFDRATMEMALSHRVGNAIEMAYSRSDLFDKRRGLMQRWGAYLSGSRLGKVVNFQG